MRLRYQYLAYLFAAAWFVASTDGASAAGCRAPRDAGDFRVHVDVDIGEPNVFNTMSKGLQPMVGFKEKYLSLIHVSDLVRGIVLSAECANARGKTYFISSKDVYGWKEVGEVSRSVLERKVVRLRIPETGVYIVAAFAELFAFFSSKPFLLNFEKARDMVQDCWTCDSSKAKQDFGYEQEISLEEGIRTTVEWYKQHGWL